jgi:hypothetical protein
MKDTEIAWLAGLIEGEGCFTGDAEHPKIFVQMTDLDVIERLRVVTGVGFYSRCSTRAAHHKPSWKWAVQSRERARELMALLFPHMGVRRRARIKELLHAGPVG